VRFADVLAQRRSLQSEDFTPARAKLMLALFFVVTRIRSFDPGSAILAKIRD
jgi:hypothetical protein